MHALDLRLASIHPFTVSVMAAKSARFLSLGLGSSLVASVAMSLIATPASAVTTLTVDLSSAIGPAKHVASGSLYGVTETLPADVNGLIAPLRPRMFTNPAANVQQPVGDAILVAGRVASTGATVTIRLADWLKGFYTFTSMNDWLDKVAQTVARRKSANLSNVYGYEIWNEPGGTWASSNPLSFNDFWKQTYARLRELDPDIKIIGPSYAWYNQSFISGFLSFCKTNGCLPDIIGWHELGGGDIAANVKSYRALEQQLGVGPLPISINEYSGAAHIDVEGQPGASAPLIAKFERLLVDSACISYWDVSHAGRLGSLLASNTQPNGGWWFYKWYGEMSGNMVSTTPPSPASATALDGFANLDVPGARASVLFGGANDGTIQIVVKGFSAASVLGNRVHAVVERTPFVNRTTAVTATSTLSTADINVVNDQITVSVSGANASDGYRLALQPVGAGGTGNTGAGGAASGGTAGASSTNGGKANANGGGANANGGGTNANSGGANANGGGANTNGGSTNANGGRGGTDAGGSNSGGRGSSGGTSAAGASTAGGANPAGGSAPTSGGNGGTGGTAPQGLGGGTANGGASPGGNPGDESNGCACRLPPHSGSAPHTRNTAAGIVLALGAIAKRRRRTRLADPAKGRAARGCC